MKIAINGSIIETENIYEITRVEQDFNSRWATAYIFTIKMFHDVNIPIRLAAYTDDDGLFTIKSKGSITFNTVESAI